MLTFTEATVRAALADPATADLPDGPLKGLLLALAQGFDSYGIEVELVVRTVAGRDRPGKWPCRAPGLSCENPARCERYGRCCHETWAAVGSP